VHVIESPLVERERELEALGRVLEAARRGDGGAALVEGPPGIGKSRLLAAAASSADDLEVLRARASELERDFPFGVVRQLFEPVLFGATEEEREQLLAGAGRLAERVLVASAADDGGADAYATLHGLFWFAANLAASRSVLLLVDDAQWSDAASLRWLAFLLRRLEGVPLAVVAAVRSGEAGGEEALLDELVSDPSVREIRPAVLSDAGVARLVEHALGAAPDAEFLTACQRATGGNPFLMRELLGELAERGVDAAAEDAPVVERLSASGVGRAVRGRMRRLPPGCLELARAVSVLGDGCELSVAARLAGLDEPAAAGAADALAAASVLEPERPLAFVHPLVRASVYEEFGTGDRSARHAQAARVLTEERADVDRIAVHLLASDPRGDEDAAAVLRAAADGARRRGANEVAATYLRRALAEPPAAELLPELAHELGAAALRAGDLATAIEQLREATRGLSDQHARAQAAAALGSSLFLAYRPDEAVAELGSAIDGLSEGGREQGLRLQATRWTAARASLAAWRGLRERGDRFAVPGAAAGTTGERLMSAVAGLHAVRERTAAEARALAAGALADAELLADPGPEAAAFWIAPLVLLWADALEQATEAAGEAMDWAGRHGSLPAFAMGARLRAFAWWRRGSLAEAEADAASALEHGELPGFPPYGSGALANVLLARGKLPEAERVLGRPPFEPGSSRAVFYYLQARARLRAAQQRPEDALDDLFACGRLEQQWEIATPAFSSWRADAAPLLAELDRADEARSLAREEVGRCRAFGAAGPLGAALRALGLVEPGDAGIAHLEEAVDVLAGSGARLEHALALLELGAAVRRASRRADARERLREALELARRCGADAVAGRAHDELVAAGARPRRDPIESRSKLTASEQRVARLAAEGMTNREIAQGLFVTEKTVEVHLTRAYRKLDIQSRSQLARALPAASSG
jgi:DNA-binding CsgD family transcriptional regulator